MKNILIVTPYFLPSNLASVHRSRIMSKYLNLYGWNPIILTVDYEQYSGNVDLKLKNLIPDNIRVEKVQAVPLKISKKAGLTDVSIRGLNSLIKRASEIVENEKIDLIYVTVLPGYGALVGKYIKKKYNIPFVLDYQDPWVYRKDAPKNVFKKSTIVHWISVFLERSIIKYVDAITAVSDRTLDSLRCRNLLGENIPIGIFPIGIDNDDLLVAKEFGKNYLQVHENSIEIVYLGTITKEMMPSLEIILQAIRKFNFQDTKKKIHFTLIGTSANIEGVDTLGVNELIKEKKLEEFVLHQAGRISYLDSMNTMQHADALFLIGTNEPHYTASKIFPYWISGTSIIGLFHKESEIVNLSNKIGGVKLVTYNDHIKEEGELVEDMYEVLFKLYKKDENFIPEKKYDTFKIYEANMIAQEHAHFFNEVLQKIKEKS